MRLQKKLFIFSFFLEVVSFARFENRSEEAGFFSFVAAPMLAFGYCKKTICMH